MTPHSPSFFDHEMATHVSNAHRRMPNAYAVVFRLDTHIIETNLTGPLVDLPWKPHPVGDATSLLELFDAASHGDVRAAIERALMTSTASTTVRTVAGQSMLLGCDVLSHAARLGAALISPAPKLHIAEQAFQSATRTRVICDNNGTVVEAIGGPGSYASFASGAGQWATRLIGEPFRDIYLRALQTVIDGEPYASLQAPGTGPNLYFGVNVVRTGDRILIDLHDRSHQVAALDAFERSRAQFDQLSETLPVGVFVVEPEGRTKFASEKLQSMLGARIATEFGWIESIHPDDQAIAARAFAELPTTRRFNIELRTQDPSGDYFWSRWVGSDVRTAEGELEFLVGFVEDISEWRELNNKIAYQASFDGLTDLPNRMTLIDELRTRLENQDPASMVAVLFIDLDGFKLINDTQGHSVGDIVLLEVAQRFRRALRPQDIIGRFGGDEFLVVASDIAGPQEAITISRRLHEILETPLLADGRIINVNASVGIALSESESRSEELIGNADIAMYEAKASGRNRSVVFDATLRARASQRFDMTADLRHARRRRELRLDYQPIVSLKTNRIVGAEALVRWEHPSMGRLGPQTFIPLAEEIGLIHDIGEWVVEQACADLDRLRGHELADDNFTMSVNASAHQFEDVASLATSALDSLDQYGLRPHNLRFELTESVPLTQIPDAANRIRQLTSYGFGLAIDDFGTGYSSLGYLTMLPFDVLKLDLSLTAQLKTGSAALAVVDSLTRMSAEIDFEIVAEGIETDEQKQLLRAAGVHFGQGYEISRPCPLASLIELLERDAQR